MGELIDKLSEYGKSDAYAFHMPGHKRQDEVLLNPYLMDITEINGFDNLHNPEGILARLLERICRIYDCDHAWISVNGSTGGLLAAISAVTDYGDEILIARNSHQAVYHAAQIRGLRTRYIYPNEGVVSSGDVTDALENNPEIKVVVITSPTYEGFCSDIDQIANCVHEKGAKLIVDAAHGSHLGFDDAFPKNPLQSGADIVIMSTHKTLPAVTQTAIICANGDAALAKKITDYFDIFITSSPSYLLMASVEHAMDVLENAKKEGLWVKYKKNLTDFYTECEKLEKLKVLQTPSDTRDFGKLVIKTGGKQITGSELAQILRSEYHLEVEMASRDYIIAMTSLLDSKAGFERLEQALFEIDGRVLTPSLGEEKKHMLFKSADYPTACIKLTLAEAAERPTVWTPLEEAIDSVSGAYVYAYPPGIPILAPGEIVTKEIIEIIRNYNASNVILGGLRQAKDYEMLPKEPGECEEIGLLINVVQ